MEQLKSASLLQAGHPYSEAEVKQKVVLIIIRDCACPMNRRTSEADVKNRCCLNDSQMNEF